MVETIIKTQIQQTKDIQSLLDFKDHITLTIQSNSQSLEDLKNNPTQVSKKMDSAFTEERLSKQDREHYWQRQLNESRNGLVFTGIPTTSGSVDTDPLDIFKEKVLGPLGLSHSDTAKATPTHIVDTTKNKPNRKSHYFICSFYSPDCIMIFKQSIKKLPWGMSFKPSVPEPFQKELNEYIAIQAQFRQLKDKSGNTLHRTRLNYSQGHIILERQDRVSHDSWTPWRTHCSYLPPDDTPTPKTTVTSPPLDRDLLTYKWPEPFNPIEQAELCDKLREKDYIERTVFNRSGHILNVTIKNIQNKQITISELSTNNAIAKANLSTL